MILETVGVTKRFGGLVAVKNVSLSVKEGEIFGLIGPNGAGKTTLLNVIAGLYRADGGSVRLAGEDITRLRPYNICRRGIARTFQISRPFPAMSALENVTVAVAFGSPGHRKDQDRVAAEMLDFVEFPVSHTTLADDLNTIQLKRLDLARALASRPRVLLLDELAAGLTPSELDDLIVLIYKIRERGITIIAVEHLLRMIMNICDRVAVLQQGEKIADDTPSKVANDRQVIDVYLGEKYLSSTGGGIHA